MLGGAGLLVLLAVVAFFALPPRAPTPSATAFRLEGIDIVEPGIGRRGDRTVEVREGRISAVGSSDDLEPADVEVVDRYRGSVVVPGLVDMHTHLPPDTALNLTEYFGLLYLLHGVTTVREAGDLDGTGVDAAIDAYEAGRAMPRITSCGPFVGGPDPRWDNAIVVESPDQAAGVLARLHAEGRTCIKVYDDLDRERIRALVRAADDLGIAAIGHVPFGMTFEEAALPDTQHLMGVAPVGTIEAGDHVVHRIMDWRSVDDARVNDVVRLSAEWDVAHTPTLVSLRQMRHFADYEAARSDPTVILLPRMYRDVTWSPEQGLALYRDFGSAEVELATSALRAKQAMVAKLHEAGVRLHVGTDTQQPFVVPGASMWEEMRLFVEAGVPTEEVWAYATWRAGESSGIDRLGRIEAGAPAHLLVFEDDPTRDLAALGTLQAVVVDGRLFPREDLEAAAEEFRTFFEGPVIDPLSVALTRRILARAVKRAH